MDVATIKARIPHAPNGNRGESCDKADADARSLADRVDVLQTAIGEALSIFDHSLLTSEGRRAVEVLRAVGDVPGEQR